jgi:hypothetical protein
MSQQAERNNPLLLENIEPFSLQLCEDIVGILPEMINRPKNER